MQLQSEAEYKLPASVRDNIVLVGFTFGILLLILAGTRYRWFTKGGTMSEAVLAVSLLVAFLALFLIVDWTTNARRYVLRVTWNGENLILHPKRGAPVTLPWRGINHATVPAYPRGGELLIHFRYPAPYTADIFPSGQTLPYRVPLTWSHRCRAFLETLEERVDVIPGEGS